MTSLLGAVPPRQQRSRESTERVLAAVLDLLADGGPDAVTIAAVSAVSGVSVGAIYGRFTGKETLLLAAQDRLLDQVRDEVDARLLGLKAVGPVPPAEYVTGFVRMALATFVAHERLLGRFVTLGAVNPAIGARAGELLGAASATIAAAAGRHPELFGVGDPAASVDLLFRVVLATLERRVVSGASFLSRNELEWAALEEELIALALRYLRIA